MEISVIHIENSAFISKKDFIKTILKHQGRDADRVIYNRTMTSLCREWAVHNFLYNLGIARDRTRSVDLEYPIKWYYNLAYWLMGWCRIFIK